MVKIESQSSKNIATKISDMNGYLISIAAGLTTLFLLWVGGKFVEIMRWHFSPPPPLAFLDAVNSMVSSVRLMQQRLPKSSGTIAENQIQEIASQMSWYNARRFRSQAAAVNQTMTDDVVLIEIDQSTRQGVVSEEAVKRASRQLKKLEKSLHKIQRLATTRD